MSTAMLSHTRRIARAVRRGGNGWAAWILAAAFVLGFSPRARAQFGPPPSSSQGTQAAQLPLSGRTAQSNGSVNTSELPISGTTTSVNTINSTVQAQGSYAGSTSGAAAGPLTGKLSLNEAVRRGLAYNLGQTGATQALRQAQGQSKVARSALLPNLSGTVTSDVQTTDLQALGFHFTIPGFSIPAVVGPFYYTDVRGHVSQSVFDYTAISNHRAADEIARAVKYSAMDARDLIVLAVGGTYLQVQATKARVVSEQAQLDSANAVYQQSLQQLGEGLVAKVDADRNEVQALTHQQRLLSLLDDLAKQKIALARMAGLPPNDQYDISDDAPTLAVPAPSVEAALQQALEQRADLKASEAQMRAAERASDAAHAERYPAASVNADYGLIGPSANTMHTTFTVTGTVRIPIWLGGRTEGDIEQAGAALAQRKAEYEDLRGQIESDVRGAFLDLQAASSQVEVAQKNLEVNRETLELTRQKVEAGVTDNVTYVQAQEAVTDADLDYINSLFAENLAKLSLARATGSAALNLAPQQPPKP